MGQIDFGPRRPKSLERVGPPFTQEQKKKKPIRQLDFDIGRADLHHP